MSTAPPTTGDVPATVVAALLLCARPELERLALQRPGVDDILAATHAGRSRAYELAAEIRGGLPLLDRPPGRPTAPLVPQPSPGVAADLAHRVLRFVMEHPGCVNASADHGYYAPRFRRFIVDLRDESSDIELGAFAEAVNVPPGTLKDWMRSPPLHDDPPGPPEQPQGDPHKRAVGSDTIDTIVTEWNAWDGTLAGFCDHLRDNKGIPYGRTLITHVIQALNLYTPDRRPGRSPDENAVRRAFETFFPGAQWCADGSCVSVEINGERFDFNLELEVDAYSGAFVGASIRDTEDSAAVIDAFEDAVQNTGAPPIAQLLDNRPCNDTPEVNASLGDTKHIRTTPGRPQNNGHIEGGFGLFKDAAPPIVLSADSPRDLAAGILALVVQTFSRTLNNRPRRDRGNKTRVNLYHDVEPTPEQKEQARAALEERMRRQDQARATRHAHMDPLRRHLLDDAFGRFAIADDHSKLRDAIARYPLDSIIDGIATFDAKRTAQTLPHSADGRYLLGIVRNVTSRNEGMAIADALWRTRIDVRDELLIRLRNTQERVRTETPEPTAQVKTLADLAVKSEHRVVRTFWLRAISDIADGQAASQRASLYASASRRILGGFSLPYPDRLDAVRHLAATMLPVE